MRLPASQYSVLDAERIERVDDNTFRCYVYKVKFFNFEMCPVLLVRVDEEPFGCSINLLSCEVLSLPWIIIHYRIDFFKSNLMIFFVLFHLQLQVEGFPRDESQDEKFSGIHLCNISDMLVFLLPFIINIQIPQFFFVMHHWYLRIYTIKLISNSNAIGL